MQRSLLVLAPLLALAMTAPSRQEPAPIPLPSGVVARVDGQELLLEDYKEYLWRQTGKRLLPQWVDDRLVEQACARFGATVDAEAVAAKVAERLEQVLQGRDQDLVEQEMRLRGLSFDTLRENLHAEVSRNLRLDALVRATRVATDERLRVLFEAEYGADGVRIDLRQVLCMPHVMRAELIRGGADPASIQLDQVQAQARARAESARARIAAGESFAAVAAELSHDPASSQAGGVLPVYRPGLYGAEFAAALEGLEIGRISPVIESSAGFHVVQITQRVTSNFQQLRETLVQKFLEAEPTWQEREELLAGLRAQAKIELW